MHPKMRRRIDVQIEAMEFGIANADLFRQHPNHPHVAENVVRIAREENLPPDLALHVFVEALRNACRIRLQQLQAIIDTLPASDNAGSKNMSGPIS